MAALLSWNEIKARAHTFVREWEGEQRERAEAQSFWNQFFNIFGITRRRVVTFERHVQRYSSRSGWGRIDAFWPGTILIEHKSRGEDLDAAFWQATDYFAGILERDLPRVVLVCDFERFRYHDLETGTRREFELAGLPENVELFGFIAGYERRKVREELPANRKAAELMGKIHDALDDAGYRGHALEVLLVRLMFCLFSEDTGIFEKGIFQEFLETRSAEDGSDLGPRLTQLFDVLDTPENQRMTTLDDSLKIFPYINGQLFTERLPMPAFDRGMRDQILNACGFQWSSISPAIFGAMFQSIMNRMERRNLGAHYTPESSILKVIGPLFLDALHAEFNTIKALRVGRLQRLERFHEKLARLVLFDPACGCGNFLVVAYREIRFLEVELIRELMAERQTVLDVSLWVRINVDQMIGIELEEWPARIAETALWLMDHQANRKLLELGQVFVRLPLRTAPHIVIGNALRMDWTDVVPRERVTHILGNPPFIGKRFQSPDQRTDMAAIFRGVSGHAVLDYVTAWYAKAAEFIQGTLIECAFVSTNSITQGEQVAPFWRALSRYRIRRNFAHRTFKWTSEGRGTAAVHVIILGFATSDRTDKVVFDYPDIASDSHAIPCQSINAYLVPDGADVIVADRRSPWAGVPEINYGSMANDDGNLIIEENELDPFLASHPDAPAFAEKFVKPFLGSKEWINGLKRYCLWLRDATPTEIASIPEVRRRVEAVRLRRLASTRPETRELANTPTLFGERRQPTEDYLFIPGVSSENRRYVPMGFTTRDTIVSDLARSVASVGLWEFGVLMSAIHMAWLRSVGGRLKSDYRYSCSLVYNTFPWPPNPTPQQRTRVEGAAQSVLDARALYPNETLDRLYSPVLMPAPLAEAHARLDRAVDRCYRSEPFRSEVERLRHLFALYENMLAGAQLAIATETRTPGARGRRGRRTAQIR
jgi:hypothetical protein